VSSYATRTSPVLRGKWILDNLLNAPPPDPPPDVPNLNEASIGTAASLREQLEAHRHDPTCASCHRRIQRRQNPQRPSKTRSGFSGGEATRGAVTRGVYGRPRERTRDLREGTARRPPPRRKRGIFAIASRNSPGLRVCFPRKKKERRLQ